MDRALDGPTCCRRLRLALQAASGHLSGVLVDHFVRGYSNEIAKLRRIPLGNGLKPDLYGQAAPAPGVGERREPLLHLSSLHFGSGHSAPNGELLVGGDDYSSSDAAFFLKILTMTICSQKAYDTRPSMRSAHSTGIMTVFLHSPSWVLGLPLEGRKPRISKGAEAPYEDTAGRRRSTVQRLS